MYLLFFVLSLDRSCSLEAGFEEDCRPKWQRDIHEKVKKKKKKLERMSLYCFSLFRQKQQTIQTIQDYMFDEVWHQCSETSLLDAVYFSVRCHLHTVCCCLAGLSFHCSDTWRLQMFSFGNAHQLPKKHTFTEVNKSFLLWNTGGIFKSGQIGLSVRLINDLLGTSRKSSLLMASWLSCL